MTERVKYTGRVVPWGYERDPEDKEMIVAVPERLKHIHIAYDAFYHKNRSIREVYKDFAANTNSALSMPALYNRIKKLASERKNSHIPGERPALLAKSDADKRKTKKVAKSAGDAETRLRKQLHRNRMREAWLERKLRAIETTKEAVAGEGAVVTPEELESLPPTVKEHVTADENIIFKPNPGPQTDFLAATEREVFYGGARGGGKSYAMLVDPIRYVPHPSHRALIIRRTMPELRDLIYKSQQLYPKAFPGAKWREQDKEWRFPSGARIEFGYAENMQDALRYQGQSYSWIGVDEVPQYPTPDIVNFLRSSLRSTDPNLPTYLRLTGNPGNVGSGWVKEMFIDPAPVNTAFSVPLVIQTPSGPIKSTITRRYVPARVYDNPYLMHDNDYITMLASLPETQRKQFLEGDWDAFDGAAFSEFRKEIHTCRPFPIPPSWVKFRAGDWGYSSPACVLWFAVDYDNNLYVYREYYGKGLTAPEFALKILELEAGETIRYGVLDPSTWAKRGDPGPSIAEQIIRAGCRWRPAERTTSDQNPRSRIHSKLEIHDRLKVDPDTGKPRLIIFDNCVNLIRTLPTLPTDPNDPEDVDTRAEDHAYDALRYGCSSRPMNLQRTWAQPDFSRSHAGSHRIVDEVFGF